MRGAIYARKSTALQREASIEDQIRAATRTAASLGLDVVATFTDTDLSGGLTDRPGYQALLAAARQHDFDVIIAEDISRLWRARAEYGMRSAELEDLGVHLVTCVGDDTRRDGYGLVLGIKAAIAESQRREISYRTVRGMEGLAVAGKSCGGRCYGYGSAHEADTVRRMFEWRAGGLGVGAIAARLNAAGNPSPRGKRWSEIAVKRILANPRYAGRLEWGRTQRRARVQDGRRIAPVMRPGGALVSREIPALVDPSLYAMVQSTNCMKTPSCQARSTI